MDCSGCKKNKFSAVVDAALAGRQKRFRVAASLRWSFCLRRNNHRLVEGAVRARESFAEHLMAFPGGDFPRIKAAPRDVSL